MIIQFADAFHVIGKLQAVEVGEVAAVDVMPRVVAVKIRWKVNTTSSAFILRVGVNQSVFETEHRDAGGSDRSRRCRELPSFRQVPASGDRYRIDIQQSIIKLGGKGIDTNPLLALDGLKVLTCPLTQ